MIRGAGCLQPSDEQEEGKGPADPAKATKRKRDAAREGGVGQALRSVYTETVNEQIPSEFMDLLSKLD